MGRFDCLSFYGHENEELQKEYERMFHKMTQEEKELLLKDLCARLPYEVKIATHTYNYCDVCTPKGIVGDKCYFNDNPRYDGDCHIDEVKPYLRPMSSMTEEEKEEYNGLLLDFEFYPGKYFVVPSTDVVDWLNAHHFDYRGLIPIGLALEAQEGMYE